MTKNGKLWYENGYGERSRGDAMKKAHIEVGDRISTQTPSGKKVIGTVTAIHPGGYTSRAIYEYESDGGCYWAYPSEIKRAEGGR